MGKYLFLTSLIIFLLSCSALADWAPADDDWDDEDDYGPTYATRIIDLVYRGQSVCVVVGLALDGQGADSDESLKNPDGTCRWENGIRHLYENCGYDKIGGSITNLDESLWIDIALDRCDSCEGLCSASFDDCQNILNCISWNCSQDSTTRNPLGYYGEMGDESDAFTLRRYNQEDKTELLINQHFSNSNAFYQGSITEEYSKVADIWIVPDLCVPIGNNVYSLKNLENDHIYTSSVSTNPQIHSCMDDESICKDIQFSDGETNWGEKQDDNDACGCDVSQEKSALSLAVIMILIGLFAFGLSIKEI